MKTKKTHWLIVAAVIAAMLFVSSFAGVKYVQHTADPETLSMIAVFMDDFRPCNLFELPSKQPPLSDNMRYYFQSNETWKP